MPTEIYIDPSIDADSGTGTIGDPYGDLQYALDNETLGAAPGSTRLNIKEGADEVLASTLDWGTNFLNANQPAEDNPLFIEGYTAAAGDGGVGSIDGNGDAVINMGAYDYVCLRNLEIFNGGSATLVTFDDFCSVFNCEVHGTTGTGIDCDLYSCVMGCWVYDCGTYGLQCNLGCYMFNDFVQGTNKFVTALLNYAGISGGTISYNRFLLDDTSNGIMLRDGSAITHNTIFSNGGTGTGIGQYSSTGQIQLLANNILVGFSGAGGIGVAIGTSDVWNFLHNTFHDCDTNFSIPELHVAAGNESLGVDPLSDALNFDFEPNDVGQIRGGAFPLQSAAAKLWNMNRGAVQADYSGGSGGILKAIGNGGLIG